MVASAVPSGSSACCRRCASTVSAPRRRTRSGWLSTARRASPRACRRACASSASREPMLTYGVQTRSILGVPVRMTSPARTVVDCFRYRDKIGLDVALEALRDAVRSRTATVDEIMRAAEVCRARTVMQPYLEALSP